MYPVSFGGQRSIQLSYGRLSASIDESGASSNGPYFAQLDVGGSLLRQSSGVRIVSGAPIIVCRGCAGALAHHRKHYRLVLRIKLSFLDGLGASQ